MKGRTGSRKLVGADCSNGSRLNSQRIKRDIIVIGGSAGGIEVLRRVLGELPADCPAAIAIVLHRSPHGSGSLASVLARQTTLSVYDAEHGMRFTPGSIYLAPSDHHMLLQGGRIALNRGPKQNSSRPSIDPLFRSAAAYQSRVVALLLTGGGDDGVDGMIAIKEAQGLSLVQDPKDSLMPYLPINAIRYDHVDAMVPVASIAEVLITLASGLEMPCSTT